MVIKENVCVVRRLLRVLFLLNYPAALHSKNHAVFIVSLHRVTMMCWLKGIFNNILAKFIKHTHSLIQENSFHSLVIVTI